MKHLLNMTADEIKAFVVAAGQPGFRAKQIVEWVWRRGVTEFAAMTNLPAAMRTQLAETATILSGRSVKRSAATDGVVKLLVEWPDGERIETVMIPAKSRRTACVSTQVGCAIGCAFCASGLDGVSRDLTAGEIVEQVFALQADCGERITHVVLMGMGEPLANYDATIAAVRAMIDPHRGGLSGRHITLSTVGLPGPMNRLADESIPLTLAISLHAPNDELRRKLIPTAKSISIAQVVAAGRNYFERTGRELTLEYTLLAGVNDSPTCATELIEVAHQLRCNVNLIRYNAVPNVRFEAPDESRVITFRDRLRAGGVNVQIRASRGAAADAACGQLRKSSQ